MGARGQDRRFPSEQLEEHMPLNKRLSPSSGLRWEPYLHQLDEPQIHKRNRESFPFVHAPPGLGTYGDRQHMRHVAQGFHLRVDIFGMPARQVEGAAPFDVVL